MYKSPIDVMIADIQHQIAQQQDEEIYKAVVSVGINVDKDELIRALRYDRDQYSKGYADGTRDAAQKWIPVTERLPDNNERVLVYHDDGMIRFGINKGGFADVVSTLYLKHNHRTCFSKVTHWMPLPEPPKGE